MIRDIKESQEMCDWLIERGLGLNESAWVLCHLIDGDTLDIALIKVFKQRELKLEAVNEKVNINDWSCPIAH